MKLIHSVEIAYFRSIYKEKIDKLEGTNILFGRNDSGKSNVLRALNLFFNNQTNPGQAFSFPRDFSHARLAEQEGTEKRKFVYVKVWFNTPDSWRKSLGESFWVRRQWSITRQSDPIVDSSIKGTASQQYLTRFLNKVKFHYVPAIKDRRIFESLLGEIYEVLANEEEFLDSLKDFSAELRGRTSELSSDLLESLALQSIIAPPTDLSELFRSLDFETESELGDAYSLTLQRGDGIQVRHIPAILAFLSDRSSPDFHVWGFEEPENSLELANAIHEANRFRAYGADENKQVFLTSHSPAFFSLKGADVARFFVSREKRVESRPCSSLSRLAAESGTSSELMGETPHLSVISSYLEEADARIRQLRTDQEELRSVIESAKRSVVFLEGESDVIVFRAAWEQFIGVSPPLEVLDCSGTTKMKSLAAEGPVFSHLVPGRAIFVLVDNDFEGRALYKNGHLKKCRRWVPHPNKTYWRRLPFTREFETTMNALGLPKETWPGSLENIFSAAVRRQAMAEGALSLVEEPHAELTGHWGKIMAALKDEGSDEHLYVVKTHHDWKVPFAEWIAECSSQEPKLLEPFKDLIHDLSNMLN